MGSASGQGVIRWAALGLCLVVALWLLQPGDGVGATDPSGWVDAVAAQVVPSPTDPPTALITGAQLRNAYGVTQVPYQGAGKVVAIVDLAAPTSLATNVAQFANANGLPTPMLTVVTLPSGCNAPTPTTLPGTPTPTRTVNDIETELDVQMVHAIAPAAQIVLICGDHNSGISYASTLAPNVVSMSFKATPPIPAGSTTRTPAAVLENLPFANNSIWVASAGDYGNDVEPQWPARSANVVSAGGTSLYLTPGVTPGGYFTEYAWSCPTVPCGTATPPGTMCPDRTCGGGGVSTIHPVPPYQTMIIPNYVTTPGRLVPDVAADAYKGTGIIVVQGTQGTPGIAFGTSAAAPIWAGMFALAAPPNTSSQQALAALYSLARSPTSYAANFHDIQFGINGNCGLQCQANSGYDLLTGLGSPRANVLVPTLGALLGATPFPTATSTPSSTPSPTPSGTPTDLPATATIRALTATPTDLPATATVRALTATPTDLPATATVRALTATPTDLPATATVRALTATPTDLPTTATVRALTATPTDLPATATVRALTATPTDLPATATVRALTATPTDLPATATVRALTRTATPTLSLPVLPASGTPGVPCTTVVGSTCNVAGGLTGTWAKTSSGVFNFTGTAPAGALAGIPAVQIPTTANAGGETFFNACSAVTGPGSTTRCAGTTVGDVLQGATIVITYPNPFLVGVTSTGTATGPGIPIVPTAPPLLPPPPVPFLPPPPPPPPLLPPPLLPPLPVLPPGAAPAAASPPVSVPVIPEADSIGLVLGSLVAVAALVAYRARRRRDD